MKMKTTNQSQNKEPTDFLSDYGLQPRMTVSEVLKALENVRTEMGSEKFNPVEQEININLKRMKQNTTFYFRRYFTGWKLKIWFIVTFRFILEHYEYEFSNDYSKIIRRNLI